MTVDDPHHREYRYSGGDWLWAGLAAPLAGAGFLVVRLALDDEVPTAVPVAIGVAFAALVVFVVRLTKVTATISDRTGLTAKGAFRGHATAWSDVQGIEVEVNPGAGARGAPGRIAVLYDASGRRRVLPHLNDRNTPDLDGEVADLHETWTLHRGEDWAPVPDVAQKIARVRRHPTPLVHIAVKAMVGAFLVGTVGCLIALATGAYSRPGNAVVDTVLDPFALILVLPLGVYIGTLVVGAILRRR
ncbi:MULTISPECIES: hypothetical protein [unclassified Saccharothrix]|uniref:hypothetical protein n=1 Tax=unclassified Saccharothrix TaxID=2593673 RepID=UPI00307EEA8B